MDWLEKSICRQLDLHTDFWFPPVFKEERTAPESQYFEIAKMVCEQCPIQEQCRELGRDEEFGVWGGTTPKERRTGVVNPPKKVLPFYSIRHSLPKHSPDIKLDIPAIREKLKSYTERRVKA